MIIYKVTNLIDGKIYIGQTIKELEVRKRQHLSSAFNIKDAGFDVMFHRAIRESGKDNFIWEIIERLPDRSTQIELDEREKFYIKKYNSYYKSEKSNGYNMTQGGQLIFQASGDRIPSELKRIYRQIRGIADKMYNRGIWKFSMDELIAVEKLYCEYIDYLIEYGLERDYKAEEERELFIRERVDRLYEEKKRKLSPVKSIQVVYSIDGKEEKSVIFKYYRDARKWLYENSCKEQPLNKEYINEIILKSDNHMLMELYGKPLNLAYIRFIL